MKVRIKFTRQGAMKFIGHLDIMRYFQKAMRRADVDIRYSEGFSPHQIMSFAAPLGVGLTSSGEYMDIEVNTMESSAAMVRQLNDVMVEGIQIVSCKKLEDTAKNAMSMVAAADYTVTFRDRYRPKDLDGFFHDLETFYGQEQILITKKTKRGEREADLKPLIYDMHREGDSIFMKLSAGSTDNIKPELVLEAFYNQKKLEFSKLYIQIHREEVYGVMEQNGSPAFIPLEDFGEDIE